jgi:hypothetical protein
VAFSGEAGGGMGGLGPMAGPIMVMIGLVVLIAILQFTPTIGGSIAAAQPPLAWNSVWNNTYLQAYNLTATGNNSYVPSAVGMYSSNVTLVSLLVTIIIISLILAYLIRI